jgi:hypothetical protein
MMKSPHRSNRPDFSADTMLEIVADHRNGTPLHVAGKQLKMA